MPLRDFEISRLNAKHFRELIYLVPGHNIRGLEASRPRDSQDFETLLPRDFKVSRLREKKTASAMALVALASLAPLYYTILFQLLIVNGLHGVHGLPVL